MTKDWVLGFAMAAAVALYPNLIDAVLYQRSIDDINAKSWLIFFATAGPAVLAPMIFGVQTRRGGGASQHRVTIGVVAALSVSGTFAMAYFVAVIGFSNEPGLGAGIAEMIDSSFFPIAYVSWLWLADRRQSGLDLPRWTAFAGAVIICAGLMVLGLSSSLNQGYSSVTQELVGSARSRILASCALVGAGGSAIALWSLRRLVRGGGATLGVAISIRYGIPALLCLVLAAWRSGLQGLDRLGWATSLVAVAAGALLIIAIYSAAIRIENDLVQAAAMGLVPLFAVAFEMAGSELSLMPRHARIDNVGFWIGAAIAACGIVLVWREIAAKQLD